MWGKRKNDEPTIQCSLVSNPITDQRLEENKYELFESLKELVKEYETLISRIAGGDPELSARLYYSLSPVKKLLDRIEKLEVSPDVGQTKEP